MIEKLSRKKNPLEKLSKVQEVTIHRKGNANDSIIWTDFFLHSLEEKHIYNNIFIYNDIFYNNICKDIIYNDI